MKVLLLANEAPEDFALRDDKAAVDAYMKGWNAFAESMRAAGVYGGGMALEQPHTATVVSVRNGKRLVEDGPFPDSKEQLGGFVLIDVDSLEEAARWGEKCPAAARGFVDVRVIPDFGQGE